MKIKYKRAYMIIDILLSVTCIIILSLPLIKAFNIMSNQERFQKENTILANILKEQEEFINSTNIKQDIEKDKISDNYLIRTKLEKEFNEKISKYRIYIYEDDILKSEFSIIKYYE